MSKFQILKRLFQLHPSPWGDTYVFDITPLQTATVQLQASKKWQSLLLLMCWVGQHFFVIQCLCTTHLACKLDLLNWYLLTCGVCRPLSHDRWEGALVNVYNAFPTKWQLGIVLLLKKKNQKQIMVSECENQGNMTLQSLALFSLPVMKAIAEKVSEIVCRYLGGRVRKGY